MSKNGARRENGGMERWIVVLQKRYSSEQRKLKELRWERWDEWDRAKENNMLNSSEQRWDKPNRNDEMMGGLTCRRTDRTE